MLEKISKTFNKIKGKVATTAMVAVTTAQMAMVQSQAQTGDVADVVKGVLGVIVKIFPFIGGFFVLAGVFKLIMAYRNNQPEDQTAAAKDIVIGAVFIVFGTFVWDEISNLII